MLFTTDADKSHSCVMLTGRPGRFGSAPGLFVGITFCITINIVNNHFYSVHYRKNACALQLFKIKAKKYKTIIVKKTDRKIQNTANDIR